MNKEATPVVLFVYNRIGELQKTISTLQKNFLALNTELYVYSDGPRGDKDVQKVDEVREYLNTVNGFKKIKIYTSDINKGLAQSIIDGVTEVLDEHGKVIVLEDDLITSPNFLDFMNQSIKFYENDSEIISTSGYTLDLPSLPGVKDYYFGYRASSWGWGTWKDRWDKIDWDVPDFKNFINDRALRKRFNRGGSDMTKMLQNQQEGYNDSWAIRFCYHQFKYNMKTVFPTVSKVENIGFSNQATHTVGATKRFETLLDEGEQRYFNFENFHEHEIDVKLVKEFQAKFSIKARIFDKIHKVFNNY